MKRLTLMTALLATLAAPALFAQSTLNTTAPGPSMESKPGQTNNNLQNPGSNMQRPADQTGTVTTTTTGASTATETTGTTGTMSNDSTTGTLNNNDTTTGTTTGTMNNDSTTGTTTGTGSYNGSSSLGAGTSTTDTTHTSTTASTRLPRTASELPTVAIAGLLALAAFFAVRLYSKRNA